MLMPEGPGAGGGGPGVKAVVLSLFAPLCEGVLSAVALPRVGASLASEGRGVDDLPLCGGTAGGGIGAVVVAGGVGVGVPIL